MGTDNTKQETGRRTTVHEPSRGRYPAALRVLEFAGMALCASVLVGAVYATYLGTPFSDQNRFILPMAAVGGALLAAAGAWMLRLDRTR